MTLGKCTTMQTTYVQLYIWFSRLLILILYCNQASLHRKCVGGLIKFLVALQSDSPGTRFVRPWQCNIPGPTTVEIKGLQERVLVPTLGNTNSYLEFKVAAKNREWNPYFLEFFLGGIKSLTCEFLGALNVCIYKTYTCHILEYFVKTHAQVVCDFMGQRLPPEPEVLFDARNRGFDHWHFQKATIWRWKDFNWLVTFS